MTPTVRVLRVYHSAVVTGWRQRDRELRELGCEVRLVSAVRWNEGGSDVVFDPAGDDFVVAARTIGRHPYVFLYDPRPIVREMRRRTFDVLDVHEEPASLAALELRVLRRLFQRRVPIVFYGAQNIAKRFPPPFRWIERGSLRCAAGAHCCNADAARILSKKGLRGVAAVIGLGVDTARFAPVANPAFCGPVRVGYFGRLEAHKGVGILIDAVAQLPDVELVVHGDGPARDALVVQAACSVARDRITFAGFTVAEDLADAYRSVDIVAVPSLRTQRWVEQFGRVVVEAMAAGVPVVASDDGALPEVVGDAGVLVPAGDVDAWRDALAALAADPSRRAELRSRGLARANDYRWDAIARAQLELYERVLPSARPDCPMRVVYLDHTARLSGAELALARVLPSLIDLGVVAHVILGEDGPLVEELRTTGAMVEVLPFAPAARELRRDRVRPTRLPLRAVALSLRYSWLISRRLRALKPTLVHTNSLKAALYGGVGGRAAGVPVLWHVRDRIADDYLPKPAVRAVRVLARWLPSTVVANSQATLDTLGPGLGSVSVTPSPVVMDAVAANESLRRIGGPFTVAIVGRLSPWKGQHIFLDAFADALPGEQHAVIVGSAMFGEDDYEHELRAQCTRLGLDDRVTFLGFQRDVFAVLAGVDAIVHASTVPEPFGQVIVEGMAAGVPVIATAAGGPLEIITDEVDGLLVAPGDVDALARALRRLEADPMLRAQLAKNGRLRALDFTPERVAAQLLDIYRRMAR